MPALQEFTLQSTPTRRIMAKDKRLGRLYRIMLQAGHIGRKPTKAERDRAMSIIVKGDDIISAKERRSK